MYTCRALGQWFPCNFSSLGVLLGINGPVGGLGASRLRMVRIQGNAVSRGWDVAKDKDDRGTKALPWRCQQLRCLASQQSVCEKLQLINTRPNHQYQPNQPVVDKPVYRTISKGNSGALAISLYERVVFCTQVFNRPYVGW